MRVSARLAEPVTCRDRWLAALTFLSSRAFPSRLLDLNSVASDVDASSSTTPSHPVLLPGIDILNHQPLHPVSWLSSPAPSSPTSGLVSVLVHRPIPAGSQIYNNYGAKPNDELLLSYGFTLPSLPFDTCPLLLGGLPPAKAELCRALGLDPSHRFLLTRSGDVDPDLRECVRVAVADEAEEGILRAKTAGERGRVTWENEMGALDLVLEMVRKKLEVLQEVAQESEASRGDALIREDVRAVCDVYRQGKPPRLIFLL